MTGSGRPSPDGVRAHEITVDMPPAGDAGLQFIGRIRTPWVSRADCPRQSSMDGPECRVEVFSPWDAALSGLDAYGSVELLFWLHEARRDILVQNPAGDGKTYGAFALRSPVRPNPIGTSVVKLIGVHAGELCVSCVDCLDGTPLLDIKPDRTLFTPKAPDKPAA